MQQKAKQGECRYSFLYMFTSLNGVTLFHSIGFYGEKIKKTVQERNFFQLYAIDCFFNKLLSFSAYLRL